MAENNQPHDDSASLYHQCEEALLRIALTELMHEEIDALESADNPDDTQQDARITNRIDRALTRRHRAQLVRKLPSRLVVGAACLVLVCFLGLTTALATSANVRAQFMNLLITVGVDHTELRIAPVDEVQMAALPDARFSEYQPSYIPMGYVLQDEGMDGMPTTYRHRRDEQYIWFSSYNENTSVAISSEDALIRHLTIHGADAILSVEPDNSFISWSEGDRFFIVQSNNDDEQMLIRIAQSVCAIE